MSAQTPVQMDRHSTTHHSVDASPSRRGFIVAAVGGAAGAVAVLLGRPAEVRADHGTDGNFTSTTDAPAVHVVNTGVGVAFVAERTGSGGGKRPAVEMHNSSIDDDGVTILADRSGSSGGNVIEASRIDAGDGTAMVASRKDGGHGSAMDAVRDGSGDGHGIGVTRSDTGVGHAVRAFRIGDGLGHGARVVRDGTGAGNALIAARRGTGSGAAIQAFAGIESVPGQDEPGELEHPGTAVRAVGSAIGVRAEGPVGLSVAGRAAFSTAGSGTIAAGASSATVANSAVISSSHVSVALTSDPGKNNSVQWIERTADVGFTVRMFAKVGKATSFTYHIVEPAT